MGDPKDNVAKAAMFLAGFIMLTPHRIAMLCSNHVIKRFHLPPSVVSLFVYKIHNPMELSSLITTILVNLITWMNDATFKAKAINRILSILGAWVMLISSIISYRIFISGGDFGRFDDFYWSVIFMTLTNGFYSNLTFGVNFNSSLYGAGLPSSGFVTFLIHYLYKLLYNIYYWDDYDYTLVIVQYWFSIISLFINAAIWTADQVLQLIPPEKPTSPEINIGPGTSTNNVDIDIEKKSNYQSTTGGTENVTVLTFSVNPNMSFTCCTHHLASKKRMDGTVTLKNGSDNLKKNSGNITAQNVYYVNVYYLAGAPILICVAKGTGSNKEYKYYKPEGNILNPYDVTTKWKLDSNITEAPNKNNTKLEKELNKLTLRLAGILFLVMISIIFGSVIIGVIISKISSKILGVSVGLIAYTAVTVGLSRDTGIGELFKVPVHWSPILMLGVSMGTVYAFYPSISPYSLVDPDSGNTIDLWIQFSSTIPTYLIAVMDTVEGGDKLKGPGGMGPGNYGPKVNKDGDTDGAAAAKTILTNGNTSLDNASAWKTGSWSTYKSTITDALDLVASQTSAALAQSKATDVTSSINTAINDLNSTAAAITAKDILNKAINKLAGIGSHTTYKNPANSKNWNIYGQRNFWHYQWLFAIPYILCIHIFIRTLHFPDGLIGRYVKDNIIIAGAVGNMFNFVEEWLEAIGFAGGGKQGDGFNGAVSSFNVLFMLTTVNISMFTINNPKYPSMVIDYIKYFISTYTLLKLVTVCNHP